MFGPYWRKFWVPEAPPVVCPCRFCSGGVQASRFQDISLDDYIDRLETEEDPQK